MSDQPKKLSNDNDVKEIKEFSILNMAVYLFRRQDIFLTSFQTLHNTTAVNADYTGRQLVACLSTLKHAILPTEYALMEKDRKEIDRELDELSKELNGYLVNGGLNPEQHSKIHGWLFKIAKKLYEANQAAHMGVPRDIRTAAEDRIRQAIK